MAFAAHKTQTAIPARSIQALLTNERDFPYSSIGIDVPEWECHVFQLTERGEVMGEVTTLGIDLAKRVFALHGVDCAGRVVIRRTVRRDQLLEVVSLLSPCLIGMEAGSGAHEWARRFQSAGHTVRLMAAQFVAPYRRNAKNDGNDAEAICEAVSRPGMRFVPVKSAEQQAILSLHRVRQGFITERTATINRIRGLLAEFGVVLPLRSINVQRQALEAAEVLPHLARRAVQDLYAHVRELDARIERYDRELEQQARQSERAQRLMKIRGVGPLSARPSLPPSAMRVTLEADASSPPGSVSHLVSTLLEARTGLGALPSAAIGTCGPCSSWALARCCKPPPATRTECRAGY
jgi:transposase